MAILYKFNTTSIKILTTFCRNGHADPKFDMKFQGTLKTGNTFEKEIQIWRTQASQFQNILKGYSAV